MDARGPTYTRKNAEYYELSKYEHVYMYRTPGIGMYVIKSKKKEFGITYNNLYTCPSRADVELIDRIHADIKRGCYSIPKLYIECGCSDADLYVYTDVTMSKVKRNNLSAWVTQHVRAEKNKKSTASKPKV